MVMVMMVMVTIGSGGDDRDNDDGGVWFALLWRGWLKIYQNNPQWAGGLDAVGRIVSVLLLITCNKMNSNTNHGNDIITIAINMITITMMYNTVPPNINDTISSNINIIIKNQNHYDMY